MLCYEVLREKGHRLTPQRILILKVIYDADSHISAEEIYEQLHARYPYSNISTVYRTLELLKGIKFSYRNQLWRRACPLS